MNQIQVRLLNPMSLVEAESMMAFTARLTQRGHKLKTMQDAINLFYAPLDRKILSALADLPHPTLQKFEVLNVLVWGASRRFLAQITRHQNEVKFMSASLQYSDYSDGASFAVPYRLLGNVEAADKYLEQCTESLNTYRNMIKSGIDNDTAGYLMPQGLRNVLVISATPFQWKHMIGQRVCRRNTDETRIVMLKIWEELFDFSPQLFSPNTTGPFCMKDKCKEGKMKCGSPISVALTPDLILKKDYPLLIDKPFDEEGTDED